MLESVATFDEVCDGVLLGVREPVSSGVGELLSVGEKDWYERDLSLDTVSLSVGTEERD